jgi:peptidoglycan hydrolase-like protein with peptidoglycan-binding domain
MPGWYLNEFLTSWRNAVSKRYPLRTKASDGSIGNLAHQATVSEHNPDPDGSVDAWDCDLNLLGSKTATGSAAEVRAMKELIAEFQKQPQAQLWIFQRHIANRDIGNWKVRAYNGRSPHDEHCHFQSRPTQERKPYAGDLDKVVPAINQKPSAAKLGSRVLKKGMTGADVAYIQRWLGLDDDGDFGDKTEAKVKAYQRMRGITADGIVGPATWKQIGVKS